VGTAQSRQPELADVARLARRLVYRAVDAARTEDKPLRRLLLDHLGADADGLPSVSGSWPTYQHVNLQAGLDAWLAGPGRRFELVGIAGAMRGMDYGIGLLIADPAGHGLGSGGVTTVALPAGPGGVTRSCVQHGLYLVEDNRARLALLVHAREHGPFAELILDVAGPDADRITSALEEIRRLAGERSVFRGQVIAVGAWLEPKFGGQVPVTFLDRPAVSRSDVILPDGVLEAIERQVLGVARHAGRLRAAGQHLKRGVLLHGAPGTGKTHTVRYLLGQMDGVTAIILSGPALSRIGEACSVARALQPSVVVLEDVDLIGEERLPRMGPVIGHHPLLFQLLSEMDGLDPDIDVTFLLTTNRPEILEPALAARPGRVDLAAELPLPDAAARRRLVRLYQGDVVLDLTEPERMIERTDGVTASFLKELIRKAALLACEDGTGSAAADGGRAATQTAQAEPIRVTDEHMTAALDQLLDTKSQLTRVLLGGGQPDDALPGQAPHGQVPRPGPPRPARPPRPAAQ
jgi:ATPase family associated with various cellular activities (AAA)